MILSFLIIFIVNLILASTIKTMSPDLFAERKAWVYFLMIPPTACIFIVFLFIFNLIIGLDKSLNDYFKNN
jgi:cytochrome c oxidase subunit IV